METRTNYNHPGAPVRHSYPLAVESADFSTALGLMGQTLPYALARFGILVALTLATVVWIAVTFGGYAWLASTAVPLLAYPWFFMWLVVGGWGYWFVGRYFLYLLKAGHIAVLTELITKGQVGNQGESMFEYGKNVVRSRFGEVNGMFALDLLITGVVRAFNRTLSWISDLIPIPGLNDATAVVRAVVHASTTYIDETLFSYNLARGDENVWRSSQDGLVYYAQNAKQVLKTGAWIVVIDKLLTFVAWVVCLAPAFVVAWILPSSITLGGFLPLFVAWLFASNVRAAFLRPLFLTMVMVKFHHCVRGQEIHTEWDQRLGEVSDKFREIKDRAQRFPQAASVRPHDTGEVSVA